MRGRRLHVMNFLIALTRYFRLAHYTRTLATLPVPIGVLSNAQSTARVTAASADAPPSRRSLDHRPALVLAGILLLAEWGLQIWRRR